MLRHTCKSCGCGPLLVVLVVFVVLDMAGNVASKMKVHSFFLPNCGAALGRASKENTLGPFTVSSRARQDMAVAEKGKRGSDMLFVKILHTFTIFVRYFSHKNL